MLNKLFEAAVLLVVVAVLVNLAITMLRPLSPWLLVIAAVVLVGRWLLHRRTYW